MREEILKILDNYHVELQEAEGITEEILNLHIVSGIIAEIDSLKKFNVESVDNDGKRVIEYDKDGMFMDANELDRKILSYR